MWPSGSQLPRVRGPGPPQESGKEARSKFKLLPLLQSKGAVDTEGSQAHRQGASPCPAGTPATWDPLRSRSNPDHRGARGPFDFLCVSGPRVRMGVTSTLLMGVSLISLCACKAGLLYFHGKFVFPAIVEILGAEKMHSLPHLPGCDKSYKIY